MSGDRNRLEIFEREALPHIDSLYRTAISLSLDRPAAEDLVQETFHEAWKSFASYQPGTNCKAWLFRILFRTRGRLAKSSVDWVDVDVEELRDEKLVTKPEALARVERNEIRQIVSSLPEHYRIVLILADGEQLSYREISETLRIPVGTVMSRLNRARRIMRERFLGRDGTSRTG